MINICYTINASGCSWWRGVQPARMMEKLGLAKVYVHDVVRSTKSDISRAINECDVIFSQSPAAVHAIATFNGYRGMGKRIVVDYDDLSFRCSPLNPAYRTLGLHEVTLNMENGEKIEVWRDGVDGFNISENMIRYRCMREILYVTDAITTTTDYLRGEMLQLAPERDHQLFTVPNAINLDLWRSQPKRVRTPDKFRIGWVGAANHLEDWRMIVPALKEILTMHPNVVIVILGNVLADIKQILPPDRVEWHDWIGLDYYSAMLSTLDLDIAIAPLVDNPFTRCKSPLKWAEYAALQFPTICSDVQPYKLLRNETDTLLCADNEWADKLDRLIRDADLRQHLKENAYDRVQREFNLERTAYRWHTIFEHIAQAGATGSAPDNERIGNWDAPDQLPLPAGARYDDASDLLRHIPERSELPGNAAETGNYLTLPRQNNRHGQDSVKAGAREIPDPPVDSAGHAEDRLEQGRSNLPTRKNKRTSSPRRRRNSKK